MPGSAHVVAGSSCNAGGSKGGPSRWYLHLQAVVHSIPADVSDGPLHPEPSVSNRQCRQHSNIVKYAIWLLEAPVNMGYDLYKT